MNHKRKGPKTTRSGCLLCKPWKAMGNSKKLLKRQDLRVIGDDQSTWGAGSGIDRQNQDGWGAGGN